MAGDGWVGGLLSGLTEFTFLHTFANEPVDKGAFAVHHVEFPVKTVPRFSNRSSIGTAN